MSTKKILSIILLLALLVGFILFARVQDQKERERKETEISVQTKTHESTAHGISFLYPANYFLEEKNTGNGERARHTIILTEDTEENRLVREGETPPREGPTAITIDIFQNMEEFDPETWITSVSDSNWKLDGRKMKPSSEVTGGIEYEWSGLYEGRSVVFPHKGNMIMMSVTYLSPTDLITHVFDGVLSTLSLY